MIGKTIKSLITTNSALIALVPAAKMFPYIINEETEAPCITYTIDSLDPEYNKREWAGDEVVFTIHSFAKSYDSLQAIVSAVRTALELKNTGSGTQDINAIYLTGFKEGPLVDYDGFYNELTFKVKINTY
jgi:hypothetical protein